MFFFGGSSKTFVVLDEAGTPLTIHKSAQPAHISVHIGIVGCAGGVCILQSQYARMSSPREHPDSRISSHSRYKHGAYLLQSQYASMSSPREHPDSRISSSFKNSYTLGGPLLSCTPSGGDMTGLRTPSGTLSGLRPSTYRPMLEATVIIRWHVHQLFHPMSVDPK